MEPEIVKHAIRPETVGIILGTALVILNFIGYWIREIKKHKSWKKNGNAALTTQKIITDEVQPLVTEVKEKVDCLDGKLTQARMDLARVEAGVEAQTKKCSETVGRFDDALREQQKQLINIVRNKSKG